MTESQVQEMPEFESLLDFIKQERGFDFTGYKRPSLQRRVAKRMEAVGIADPQAYREYLAANDHEFSELFDTILINVTGFFRDSPSWQYIADEVVPRILESRDAAAPIRIWSAGCASGEEAYTAAIVFAEALGEDAFRERVKVYGTDVDEGALIEARHAIYPRQAIDDVPEELRARYFDATDSRFTFKADLRRSVIFGRHDLIRDPPISRIDLLLARNTLMYFNPETQTKILGDFHFALRDDGFLFLGKSEMLLARSRLFEPVDMKRRVFAKVVTANLRDRLHRMAEHTEAPARHDDEAVRRASFEAVPVAQLVVDLRGHVTLANAYARRLFGLAQADIGRQLQDLELSYRPLELRSRIQEVQTERHPVAAREVEWRIGGDHRFFDVHLVPLTSPEGHLVGTGVTFTEVTRHRRLQEAVEQQKERLETAYEELQSTAEELETTNEELQSTNEELETTNEELQSTNEELETMNEELQSTNEELETMNDELRVRTEELNEVNSFLESILTSLRAGVIIVDSELVVQAWNDEATELWGLRPEEAQGRHLLNLDIGLPLDAVAPSLRSALAGEGERQEVELDAVNRRGRPVRCTVRSTPLFGVDGLIRGAIVQIEARERGE